MDRSWGSIYPLLLVAGLVGWQILMGVRVPQARVLLGILFITHRGVAFVIEFAIGQV